MSTTTASPDLRSAPPASLVTVAPAAPAVRPATYRDVFRVAEFRSLFWADLTSLLGDQVAAVALAVLLYQRTGSPLAAALGYSTAFLPWAIGGPLLAAWADRLPPRRILVGCDVARAALIGCAAIPGMPLPVLGLLVLAAAMLAPPFDASRSALLPQVLAGDRYTVGMSVRDAVHQSAQLAGFVGGGALVVLISARSALALDAVTFACSAMLLRRGIRPRPAALAGVARQPLVAEAAQGLRIVAADRRLYGPLLLGVAGVAYAVVPEAIAPAYAAQLGHGAGWVGLIMAAVAAGSVLGALVMGRLVRPELRRRLMWPLALAGAAPLVLAGLRPEPVITLVLLVVAGATTAFQLTANAAFATAAPPAARGRAFGIANAAIHSAQGLAVIAAGAAAQILSPSTVVAGAALLGALAVLPLRRTR